MNSCELTTEFIETYLPNAIIHTRHDSLNSIYSEDSIIESLINKCWVEYYSNLNLQQPFELEYLVRRHRSKHTGVFEKMILIKIKDPEENVFYVASCIYINDNGVVRYFTLHKLESKILPITYVKKNQRYVLLESDKIGNLKNWGTILNPHNITDIVSSISNVNK